MRQIPPHPLFLGHLGDARDTRTLLEAGVRALVDLALNESPLSPPRDIAYSRFPLNDGAGNPPWLLRAAVLHLSGLIREGLPTLVYCGAGMSRTPAVAALSLSLATDQTPGDCLDLIAAVGPCDVSAALWQELLASQS